MTEYIVKSTDTLSFVFVKGEDIVGKLTYKNWFSFKAKLELNNNHLYQMEPKGFWGTTIELKENDNTILNFKMNWNGNIVIHSVIANPEQDFVFRHRGVLKDSFVLLNKDDVELLVVKPDFKWNKFNYEYKITSSGYFDSFKNQDILLATTIHCANYYMATITSIVVATL
ncbi:MAG: hypothetical protein JST21_09435 [Bacteroidetes bacterium]|nr:hypothetical protein [Bacteroidota bacterium]